MKEQWETWLDNTSKREKAFAHYLKSKKIKTETEVKELIQGHIEKANHNLAFLQKTLDLKDFNDWSLVVSYYSIYQASLALCALRGYSTKDHLATLLILIKEFYPQSLDSSEIKLINETTLEKEHVLNYTEAKKKRGEASYSTIIMFNKEEAEDLQSKAISFVNKAKNIIEASNVLL